MWNRIAVFVFALATATGTAAVGCAPLVSEAASDTIAVKARDAGPVTLAAADDACAERGRKSFGPLSYRCVDAKNTASCQQKAYVFACNVAPDEKTPAPRAIAAGGPPALPPPAPAN